MARTFFKIFFRIRKRKESKCFLKRLLVRVGVRVYMCACESMFRCNTMLHFFIVCPCSKKKRGGDTRHRPQHTPANYLENEKNQVKDSSSSGCS